MKILFLTRPGPDYLEDTLFHGLRSILGPDIIDYPRASRLYKGGDVPDYGNGLTCWNLLDNIQVDREGIKGKLYAGYFDYVMVGWRPGEERTIWPVHHQNLMWVPPPNKRVVLDGSDTQDIIPYNIASVYFKRENTGLGFPISFSIPEEKMAKTYPKYRQVALYKPGDPYLYEDEDEYYDDYRESRVAHTRKKAGWDCMRHYEIMSQGCLPIFPDLQLCPSYTCTTLPKSILQHVAYDWHDCSNGQLEEYCDIMWKHCKAHCTTEVEAKRFLTRLHTLRRFLK